MTKTLLRRTILISTVVSICFISTVQSNSQQTAAEQSALATWISLDAPPGWEHLATDVLMKAMPGWQRDTLGNLTLRKGSGSPRRVVACGIDRPGFAVTEITENGYLRMREAGGGRAHALWTQFHEGQRVRVLTRAGSIPGVVGVKSTHLQRGRGPMPVTTLDDLWIDVGAASKNDVQRLGVRMLDPIVRDFPMWTYADYVAGPAAGVRVGCAAVASASRGEVTSGETVFVISTLRSFNQDGLTAALRNLGHIDEITLIDQSSDKSNDRVSKRTIERPVYLPLSTGLSTISALAPRVRYPGTLVESVELEAANELLTSVEKSAAVKVSTVPRWVALPSNSAITNRPLDVYASTAALLKSFADVPSVSGHERPVREKIIAALPVWAKARATIDSEGNLVVEAGPDRDPMIFIAHLDEVGYEITNIHDDGTVALRTRGGMFQSLWEGQTALLHFDQGSQTALRGVFVPRENATAKQPEATTAWFGVDGAELKKMGVKVGLSVTSHKDATRIGQTRFTARALDDRAGSTALVLAAQQLNPALLKRKVILAWAVKEEIGLEGAVELAKHYGSTVKRVFSVDTFVSSDSPSETTRFAYLPLGQGAVIRGLDNSAVATPAELDRITSLARMHRIALQVGATNGGTDGSEFVPYGTTHVSLSWPGRYSHSPVEVLDIRDLESLTNLIVALCRN